MISKFTYCFDLGRGTQEGKFLPEEGYIGFHIVCFGIGFTAPYAFKQKFFGDGCIGVEH